MTGKIRVSIVATALDGHKTDNKTVLNVVSRIQNRNTGYNENLFSHNPRIENTALNSIDGATALKLDESYQLDEDPTNSLGGVENNYENSISTETKDEVNQAHNNIPTGVSIESASYIENSNFEENANTQSLSEHDEEYTPRLFSEDQSYDSEDNPEINEKESYNNTEELFDQDIDNEEDFEIPAFLRKQKF